MTNHWPQALVSAKTPQSITYVFRTFLSKTTVYTFFSSAHETFSRIDHMLGHKTNLHKFKNKIIQSIFFSHHFSTPFKCETWNRLQKKARKCGAETTCYWAAKGSKNKFFKNLNENANKIYQNVWDAAKAGLRSS